MAGQFTNIDGVPRYRVAAFDLTGSTPSLTSFAPTVNATVYGIAATATTVYFGGPLTDVNGTTRMGAAGVDVATGSLTDFAPVMSGGSVRQLVVSPDGAEGRDRRQLHHRQRVGRPRIRPGAA